MSPIELDVLRAAEDLEIDQEEVTSMMSEMINSAVTGMMMGFMVLAFAKGLGLSKKDQLKYEKEAEKL